MTHSAQWAILALPHRERAARIDIGEALDLLARAVNEIGHRDSTHAFSGERLSIVDATLFSANVNVKDLAEMRGHRLRDLYRESRLPVDVTLGALIVLDAAQRSEDRGSNADDVLDDATAAADRFMDLVSAVPRVTRHFERYRIPATTARYSPRHLRGHN
jgi:hypothetical protein